MAAVSEGIIKTLMEQFKSIARTETIIGKEFKAGAFTLIPISRVTLGLGGGGGSGGLRAESKGEGGGGGGGIRVDPIAFIVIKGEEISFQGVRKGGTLGTLFEKIPEMAEKCMEKMAQQRAHKKEAEQEK